MPADAVPVRGVDDTVRRGRVVLVEVGVPVPDVVPPASLIRVTALPLGLTSISSTSSQRWWVSWTWTATYSGAAFSGASTFTVSG